MAIETFPTKEEDRLKKKRAKLSREMTHKKPAALGKVEDIKKEYFTNPPVFRPEQNKQGGIGAAPGSQTPDATGTGAVTPTGTGTFQGKDITTEQLSQGVGTTTPLKDRLASYAKAIQTYEEINAAKRGERGVNRGTTIGQTGGYGLLDKSRREQRNIDVSRRSAEGDIRRAVRRGEISPRNAARQLETISQEALGRDALATKERIAAGESTTSRATLGLKARTAEAELGIKGGRLDLDTAKALIDKRFKDATLEQKKFGLGTEAQGQFIKQQAEAKNIIAAVGEGKITKEQAGPLLYMIDPTLAREILGYGPETEE